MSCYNSRKINNPFKEQHNLWIRYTVLISIAFGLTLLVVHLNQLSVTPSSSMIETQTAMQQDPLAQVIVVQEEEEEEEDQGENEEEDNDQGENEEDDDDDQGEQEFHFVDQNDFPRWLHGYFRKLKWPSLGVSNQRILTREILIESLHLGCTNLVENQNAAGNFNYQYNFVKRELDLDDSDVRQAGALWGISLCYQYDPSNHQYKAAVEKGIRFFNTHAVPGPNDGTIMVRYPDNSAAESSTGTNALFGLGMLEYLRSVKESDPDYDEEFVHQVRASFEGIVHHLKYMQLPNKHFSQNYRFDSGEKSQNFSPYYDGETMLCLVKAAKYLDGFTDLIPMIEETAPVLAKAYSVDAWTSDRHDSDKTKGFYQWSSMFLTEYYQSGWSNAQLVSDFVMVLGHWIIHTHNVLNRMKNTGYAFEGIISAYEIAKGRNDKAAMRNFESAIDKGLYKLCTWQVGGPLARENKFLVSHPSLEKIAIGGIMGAQNDANLRIDTTQHQMHALIMALASVYTK